MMVDESTARFNSSANNLINCLSIKLYLNHDPMILFSDTSRTNAEN